MAKGTSCTIISARSQYALRVCLNLVRTAIAAPALAGVEILESRLPDDANFGEEYIACDMCDA